MFIVDLNHLEVVEENIVGAGGVKFDSKIKFDKIVDIYSKTNFDNKLYSKVDVKGNFAGADATADAYGYDTYSYTLTGAQVAQGYASESFSQSVAATNGFYYYKS